MDLCSHIGSSRMYGHDGLDPTSPMSAQWLKDLFDKYAAANVPPGVSPLNPEHLDRALEYLSTRSRAGTDRPST